MQNKVKPNGKASITANGKTVELPVYSGSIGPDVIDIGKFHARPGIHVDGELREPDYLYRRRGRHPAPPRLPDRPAGRKIHLPRSLLPAAPR